MIQGIFTDSDLDLSKLFDELFPICRSIAGPGVKKTLEIIQRHIPISIEGIPTGTQVLDWTVPPEWDVNEARLTGPSGDIVVDFADHNLHVVNFSEAVDQSLSLEELQKHLHSLPNMPDAIPYVTSYYSPNWGFCLTDRQRRELKPGRYHAKIDATKRPGFLNYGVAELPGSTDDLILITSYICHPSLANNELSGPLGLVELYNRISKWERRRYTYRFLLIPETIGSISYLSVHGDELRRRLRGGAVLTCLGGHGQSLSVKGTRAAFLGEPYDIDRLVKHLSLAEPESWRLRDFTPISGSDERQFCSPGFNLPMVQIARTVYGQYDEYHTSLDDKTFMRIEKVYESAGLIDKFLRALDYEGANLKNTVSLGEPQLGRRGLYPNTNSPLTWNYSADDFFDTRKVLNYMLNVLSFADGKRNLRDIAELIGVSVTELSPIAARLEAECLLERGQLK